MTKPKKKAPAKKAPAKKKATKAPRKKQPTRHEQNVTIVDLHNQLQASNALVNQLKTQNLQLEGECNALRGMLAPYMALPPAEPKQSEAPKG